MPRWSFILIDSGLWIVYFWAMENKENKHGLRSFDEIAAEVAKDHKDLIAEAMKQAGLEVDGTLGEMLGVMLEGVAGDIFAIPVLITQLAKLQFTVEQLHRNQKILTDHIRDLKK